MRKILFVMVVAAMALISCERTVRVEGKVTDVNSGKPITGARVLHVALDTIVFSDSAGRYTLPPAPSRATKIIFNATNYEPYEVEFKPRAGKEAFFLDVELEPKPVEVLY